MKSLFFPLALAAALSACSSGTKPGDTNVEIGHDKPGISLTPQGSSGGDSATAGLVRDSGQVTGKELYKDASKARDRNHDGLAD